VRASRERAERENCRVRDWIHEFEATVWLHPGEAGWHFLTLPDHVADALDEKVGERAGFGSIPVEVTIGASTWHTSLFPDKSAASFVLPVKKAIRERERLTAGDSVVVRLHPDGDRM
jgi:hypothetical protein